jgi:hypothetical protein
MWRICRHGALDDDFVDTERQAFVGIGPDKLGSFQFGLVRGELDGYLEALEEASEGEPFWPAACLDAARLRALQLHLGWLRRAG